MFRNVLVGLSLSPSAERPLLRAIETADEHGGRLTILTALPECHGSINGPLETYSEARDVVDDLWRQGKKQQRAALERVPSYLPVSTILRQGSTWAVLMAELHSGRHDSVVIGATARSRWERLLRHPITDRLVGHSPVPVLVVTPDASSMLHMPHAASGIRAHRRLLRRTAAQR